MNFRIERLKDEGFEAAWCRIEDACSPTGGPNCRLRERVASQMLAEVLFGNVSVERTDTGRPYLKALGTERKFPSVSITHSGGILAMAWREDGEIGIDLEGPRNQLIKVYKKFLREEEIPDSIDIQKLLPLWTAKEACWKAMQEQPAGLIDVDLKRFIIKYFPIKQMTLAVAIPR